MNILLLKLGGIGDVVSATPAVRAIRKRHPNAFISLIAERPGIEVLTESPYVNEFVEFTALYRCQSPLRFVRPTILKQFSLLVRRLRSRRWDVFVSFQSLWRATAAIKPRFIAAVARPGVSAGLNTGNNGLFFTHRVADERFDRRHYVQRFLDVANAIGCPPDGAHTEVWFTDRERSFARKILADAGVKTGDVLAGIHAGANPDRPMATSWPEARFAEVARRLIERRRCKIILTGTRSQRPLTARLRELIGQGESVVDLAAKTTVKELAACIERCSLFISNDTGPMHIAVAVRTPTVGIFGPSDWQAFGTYPPELPFRMVRGEVDCWPCKDLQCREPRCMDAVSVDAVMAAAQELLCEGNA